MIMNYNEISVQSLKLKLDNKQDCILLDVRTDQELMFSRIEGSIHIPMNEIIDRIHELDHKKEIIVQCKSGKRSAKVCEFLVGQNFKNILNLKGGILAWSQEIDPSIIIP